VITLKKMLMVTSLSLLLLPVASVGQSYQFRQKVSGLTAVKAAKAEEPFGPVIYHLDFSQESSPGSVLERASNTRIALGDGSMVLNQEGLYSLKPSIAPSIPLASLTASNSWKVEVQFAPPYVTPDGSIDGFFAMILKGASHRFGLYRDGHSIDGYLYQTSQPRDGDTPTGGAAWYLDSETATRLQKLVSSEVRSITWSNIDGAVTIYINGVEFSSFPYLPADALSGNYDVFFNTLYIAPGLLVKSLKVEGK